MEAKMNLEMFKEIPGYKAILKAVLKAQIQMLVEQLCETEEESIILTASLSDGTLSHLGSSSGKDFLEGREEIKSQFLFHCLKSRTSTTVPNQNPIFIPDAPPSEVLQPVDEERPAKKPRRNVPPPPVPFGRGISAPRGTSFGKRGAVARGAARGRGTILGTWTSSGSGSSSTRGQPSGRGAGSGRARKPSGQFPARGRGRGTKRLSSHAASIVTSPIQESDAGAASTANDGSFSGQETNSRTEPDLVTVKAENFEVSIDLNSPTEKPDDAPVDKDIFPSISKPVKKHSISIASDQGLDRRASNQNFRSDGGDENLVDSTSDRKDDSLDNIEDCVVHVKQEPPDETAGIGMEAGALREMYGVSGTSGDRGNQSWGPSSLGGLGQDSITGREEEPTEGTQDNASQSSNNDKPSPVYHYLDQYGNLKTPQTGSRKYAMKRKLCQKTIAEKYLAVLEVERGVMSKTEIARTFSVPLSTLSGWIKDADSIKDALGKFGPGRCTMRKGNFQELEEELLKWCTQMLGHNVQLSGPIILERARQLVDQMDIKDCKLSSGWLDRFKERHGIKFKKPQSFSLVANNTNLDASGKSIDPCETALTSEDSDQITAGAINQEEAVVNSETLAQRPTDIVDTN